MTAKITRRTFASIALLLLCSATTQPTDQPKHLSDAQLLVNNISLKDNLYAHQNCFIHWKGEDGAAKYENRTDCSDLLALLLGHSYSVTKSQMKSWTGETRPVAAGWHDAIVAGRGFDKIDKLSDARPGDIFAIKFPPGAGDTGHIMLMVSKPEAVPPGKPMVPGTRQWNATIIDSCKSPHGKTDTRYVAHDITEHSGVGRGIVRIYTNSDGTIAGYTWSDRTDSKFESQSDRNLVIGRFKVPN